MSCAARVGLLPSTAIFLVACAGATPPPARPVASAPISVPQIEAAQRAWCDGLIEIGRVSASGGDARATASAVLSSAYDYNQHAVLFKPTLAFGDQTFRMTMEGALAYFVGGDPHYPDDKGFALKQWVSCRPDIKGTFIEGDIALAMGNVYFESHSGDKVVVDKTFGYRRLPDGTLHIILHHSSLPYAPGP